MDVPGGEAHHHHLRIIRSSRDYSYVGVGGGDFAFLTSFSQNEHLKDSHNIVVHDVALSLKGIVQRILRGVNNKLK
jgi:hypothetical protein